MKKALLWGTGRNFAEYINLVRYHELLKRFKVVGVTSNTSFYSEIAGYKFIRKEELRRVEFDIVIVMTGGNIFKQILLEVLELGISEEYIFSYRVLIHQNLDIDRYIKLKKNTPSIFANNCWGGFTYHSLGLNFNSPLINMFESTTDYLKLLKEPKKYMNEELELVETCYNKDQNINFPVIKCGDILLNCAHYDSFEFAKQSWERRKGRINWDNLFVMMQTEERELAEEFLQLPYKKKICFVPFESNEDSLMYVPFFDKPEVENLSFSRITNMMANGAFPYYDVFDLIEYAKFTQVAKLGERA